jgi:hypothetical protein
MSRDADYKSMPARTYEHDGRYDPSLHRHHGDVYSVCIDYGSRSQHRVEGTHKAALATRPAGHPGATSFGGGGKGGRHYISVACSKRLGF